MTECIQTISFDTALDVLFYISMVGAIATTIAVYRMDKQISRKQKSESD